MKNFIKLIAMAPWTASISLCLVAGAINNAKSEEQTIDADASVANLSVTNLNATTTQSLPVIQPVNKTVVDLSEKPKEEPLPSVDVHSSQNTENDQNQYSQFSAFGALAGFFKDLTHFISDSFINDPASKNHNDPETKNQPALQTTATRGLNSATRTFNFMPQNQTNFGLRREFPDDGDFGFSAFEPNWERSFMPVGNGLNFGYPPMPNMFSRYGEDPGFQIVSGDLPEPPRNFGPHPNPSEISSFNPRNEQPPRDVTHQFPPKEETHHFPPQKNDRTSHETQNHFPPRSDKCSPFGMPSFFPANIGGLFSPYDEDGQFYIYGEETQSFAEPEDSHHQNEGCHCNADAPDQPPHHDAEPTSQNTCTHCHPSGIDDESDHVVDDKPHMDGSCHCTPHEHTPFPTDDDENDEYEPMDTHPDTTHHGPVHLREGRDIHIDGELNINTINLRGRGDIHLYPGARLIGKGAIDFTPGRYGHGRPHKLILHTGGEIVKLQDLLLRPDHGRDHEEEFSRFGSPDHIVPDLTFRKEDLKSFLGALRFIDFHMLRHGGSALPRTTNVYFLMRESFPHIQPDVLLRSGQKCVPWSVIRDSLSTDFEECGCDESGIRELVRVTAAARIGQKSPFDLGKNDILVTGIENILDGKGVGHPKLNQNLPVIANDGETPKDLKCKLLPLGRVAIAGKVNFIPETTYISGKLSGKLKSSCMGSCSSCNMDAIIGPGFRGRPLDGAVRQYLWQILGEVNYSVLQVGTQLLPGEVTINDPNEFSSMRIEISNGILKLEKGSEQDGNDYIARQQISVASGATNAKLRVAEGVTLTMTKGATFGSLKRTPCSCHHTEQEEYEEK